MNFLELYGGNFSGYKAFEANPNSFDKLLQTISYLPSKIKSLITVHALGVSDTSGKDTLSDIGAGSQISSDGTLGIDVCRLDDKAYDFEPSLIKMDIESSETRALLGAYNIINDYHPILAISIYHNPEDLVDIPLWIKKTYPYYKIYTRKYYSTYTSMYEFVLYAIPPERLKVGATKKTKKPPTKL